MTRFGQNPAKFAFSVAQPARVTAAVLSYIPFQQGYFRHSLDVLKICLDSLRAHTKTPFDLMVFDNGSCEPVRAYLSEAFDQGQIQYLYLSELNLGKAGAWNAIFGAAPGEVIAYSDSDVYFFPGWLEKHLEMLDAFPHAGTVVGLPLRDPANLPAASLEVARSIPELEIEQGSFLEPEWVADHLRSLGKLDELDTYLERTDTRLSHQGLVTYLTASHFQFVARAGLLRSLLPLEFDRPMGEALAGLDQGLEQKGCLRLALAERAVLHMGNSLDPALANLIEPGLRVEGMLATTRRIRNPFLRLLRTRPFKKVMLGIYEWIFDLYYRRTVG